MYYKLFFIVVEQCEHAKDVKKSEASRGVDYFQDRLGLHFTKQKGRHVCSKGGNHVSSNSNDSYIYIHTFYRWIFEIYVHSNRSRRSYERNVLYHFR